MSREAFEAWRAKQPWYIVTRKDDDGAIHRLLNMAAQSAWDAASAQVPAGMVLVPKEPTLRHREFLEGKTGLDWLAGWKAMLAAAKKELKP